MSDRQNENALRIAAYLENKLSPTEREAFKRALSEDDGLRLQYIDALMNRAETPTSPVAGSIADEEVQTGTGDSGHVESKEGSHPGGEVADEWMGIVRGEEGAREVGMPAVDRTGTGDTGGAGQSEPTGTPPGAGIGDRDKDHLDGGSATGEPAHNGGEDPGPHRDWGAPRNWEAAENPRVTDRAAGQGEANTPDAYAEAARDSETTRAPEMSGHWEGEEHRGAWETRGEHRAREAWEAGWPGGKKSGRPGFLGSPWMVGLLVLVLLIAAGLVVMMVKRQGFWDRSVASAGADTVKVKEGEVPDSGASAAGPARGDSGTAGAVGTGTAAGAGGVSPIADSVFTRLYRPYMRGDDPVEVRSYYLDYRSGNYAAVLAVGDSTGLGTGQRKVVIRNYMRLYRGLSYLATGDAKDAVPELEGVVLRTKPGEILYETAQWYLALAWAKRTDVDPVEARNNALGLAREVANSYSRYSEPAHQFIKALTP